MITSQNVSFKAQVKIFFILLKSHLLFLRYSSFYIFNHVIMCQIYDVIVSIQSWDKVDFWIILLNHSSLSHQTLPMDWYKPRQYFSGIFWTIWRIGANFQVLFSLATCSNNSITTYVKIPMLHFFKNVSKGHFKMVKFIY